MIAAPFILWYNVPAPCKFENLQTNPVATEGRNKLNDIDVTVKPGQFFSAILEEYKIRLEAIEKGRARAVGILPVLSLTALGFIFVFFKVFSTSFNAATVMALIALGAFAVGAVLLITAASHKGLMRADVNKLLKAAKLEDAEASEAMADIYIDRINDLDRMVERQERHFRSGTWLGFGYAILAILAFLLQALIG
jgi:hypothetical protein